MFQLLEKKSSKPQTLSSVEDYSEKVERMSKKKISFIEGLSAAEQDLLKICIVETCFDIPQLKEQEVAAAIRLLKMLYEKVKIIQEFDKTMASDLSHIKDVDFLNGKIERLAKKQFQDPLQLLTYSPSTWIKSICMHCPFTLTQRTRMLLFRMCHFDKQRSLHFMLQTMKGTATASNSALLNLGKLQRLKLKVNRKAILDCGVKVMNSHGGTRSLLEFDFFDENGSGLGPTLEFYAL